MTTYLDTQIERIFNTPTKPPPRHSTHPLARTYYIGTPAKEGLRAKVTLRNKLSAYLNWIATNNPTYQYWIDNRPSELKATDEYRLKNNLTPLWTYGLDQVEDTLSLTLTPDTITTYAQLALDMGIGQQQYVSRPTYKPYEGIRSTPLDKLHTLSPGKRTGWFLRAYGNGYLIPHTQPTPDDFRIMSPWHQS